MEFKDFSIGLHIRHEDNDGKIAFIDHDYITITVSERPATCSNSRHPTVKVNLLVYPQHWEHCTPVDNNQEGVISPVCIYKAQQHRYSDVQ